MFADTLTYVTRESSKVREENEYGTLLFCAIFCAKFMIKIHS